VEHVEFFHRDHFELRYHRKKARRSLAHFIDFFWETDFDPLYEQYPEGFSDSLFPNIGYTYLVNLGTPFVMQLGDEKFEMKSDGFLPRYKNMTCHHSTGNKIFGIKFRVSPVLFEKKINFSEYREYIFPLAYLIDRNIIQSLKLAKDFDKRIEILSQYYENIIDKHAGSMQAVDIVTNILKTSIETQEFHTSIEELAKQYKISSRTLQRYFEATTSISSKQALQIMRIRSAIEKMTSSPSNFHYRDYGYYDYSHFYKHLRSFISSHTEVVIGSELKLRAIKF
jgi:AraC-like DNA-binding protein